MDGPLEDLKEAAAQERAMEIRARRLQKLIPAESSRKLTVADSRAEQIAALRSVAKEPGDRVLIWFRMLGCHECDWVNYAPPDQGLETCLKEIGPQALGAAILRLGEDPAALNGAARWVFGARNMDRVPPEALRTALPDLARHAFAHPQQGNRRASMAGVAGIGGNVARDALRRVLRGATKLRGLPEEDKLPPGGMVTYRPTADEIREPGADRTVAAWLLAKLGDREVLPEIEKLRETAEGKDATVLAKAVELLKR